MKKVYQKPLTEVYKIRTKGHLLQGSGWNAQTESFAGENPGNSFLV